MRSFSRDGNSPSVPAFDGEVSKRPVVRGIVIGVLTGLIALGTPLGGVALAVAEAFWMRSLSSRGEGWQEFTRRMASAALVSGLMTIAGLLLVIPSLL